MVDNLPLDLPFSRLNTREAIAYYVGSQKYLEALLTATHRYGLQGQELGEVTVEQQQFAQTKLTEYAENKNKFITAKKSFYLKKR